MSLKNIISFSLFGDSDKYVIGAVRNAELQPKIYPDWSCRFYVSELTAEKRPVIIEHLRDIAEVVLMPDDHEVPGLMWRFLAADDPEVSRFLSRDTDSRLSEREARACDEWIADDTIGWVMRDHLAHQQCMMGGLWAAQWRRDNWEAPRMIDLIRSYYADPAPREHLKGAYADDQLCLAWRIWPWLSRSCTQHDSVCRGAYPGAKPFPTKRNPFPRFCGEVWCIDEQGNEYPRDDDWKTIQEEE